MNWHTTRRRFLAAAGTAVAGLAGVLSWAKEGANPLGTSTAEGAGADMYGGFLLLGYGAPVPSWVQSPREGAPILEGLPGGPLPTGQGEHYGTFSATASAAGFPLYCLSAVPAGISAGGGGLIRRLSGTVFAAGAAYRDADGNPVIRIEGMPQFPIPYPLHPAGNPDAGVVAWEKTTSLPTSGVVISAGDGFTAMWIERGILWRISSEASSVSLAEVASSLAVLA